MGKFRWFMGAPPKKDRKVILYRFVDDLRFYLFEGFCWGKNKHQMQNWFKEKSAKPTWKICWILWFPDGLFQPSQWIFPVT